MLHLIERMLSVSRLDAGKIEVEMRDCCLSDLVRGVCENQQELSPSHEITVDVDGLPSTVTADPRLLDMVFTNLLSNAVKYSPESREITVAGWTGREEAVVAVVDKGVGISEEDREQLFGRFFRAGTSTGIAGTGIGLYLVKRLIDMHHGSVEVESAVGAGTTFTVRLPLDQTKMASFTAAAVNAMVEADSYSDPRAIR